MTVYDDPELAELFREDPDLLDLARAAQAREVDAPMAPNFQAYLRARLMDEAPRRLRPRGLARLRVALGTRAGVTAAFGAAAGAVMIAVTVVAITNGTGPSRVTTPTASSPMGGRTDVDPRTDAITIAFTEPMDQVSVVRAIHIEPATSYTTSWSGNTLRITPTHGLTASTAYAVRIDNVVARSSSGQAPTAPIVVAFGTQPTTGPGGGATPTPGPAVPALVPTVLGDVGAAADVVPAPRSGVIVTDVTALPTPSPSPSPSPATSGSSSTSSGTASPSETPSPATPSASPTAASTAPGAVHFGPPSPVVVGPSATAAAVSPTGRYVAAIQPDPDGGAMVVLENLDGTGSARPLARADAGSPVTWTGDSSILFVGEGHLRSVDLQGVLRGAGGPRGIVVGQGQRLVLAPQGRWAYLGPSPSPASTESPAPTTATPSPSASTAVSPTAGTTTTAAQGSLIDLRDGSTLPLPGSASLVAFAPDATAVGWVDTGATPPQVDILALGDTLPANAVPATVALGASSTAATALALDAHGHRLAATVVTAAGPEVQVLDASSHLLATGIDNASRLAFLENGDLALVAAGHAFTASVPGTAPTSGSEPSAQPSAVSPEAQALLDRLVAAQVGNGSLDDIPVAPGVDLGAATPKGVTQGYVIAVQPDSSTALVTAHVRLVSVPRPGSGDQVSFADETVLLDQPDGTSYVVTQATTTPLSPEPAGPHVVHVAATHQDDTLVVTVAFDSDLDPATVADGLSLTGPDGSALPAKVAFDESTRTVTLTLSLTDHPVSLKDGRRLTLSVSTQLHDIDGNALSEAYSTPVAP